MKTFSILTSFSLVALLFAGCATKRQAAQSESDGTRLVYSAPYEQVWRACVDAVQRDGLEVTSADRTSGYIAARRTVRPHTLGENVGIWVRPTSSPGQTEVRVQGREAGPPAAWPKNLENEIHRSIAANLSRDAAVYGTAPRDVYIERQTIAPAPGTSVVGPRETTAEREQARRLEALRSERDRREQELRVETDPARREAISRQLSTLDNDIRDMQRAR